MLQRVIKPIKKHQHCPVEQIRHYAVRSRSRDQDKNKSSVSVDLNSLSDDFIQSKQDIISNSSTGSSQDIFQNIKYQSNEIEKNSHFPYQIGQKIHQYVVIDLLSDGTFGRVLYVQDDSQRHYALKIIKSVESNCINARIEAQTVAILSKFKSNNEGQDKIVKIIEDFEFEGYYCLVFEKLGDSLYDVLKKGKFQGFNTKSLINFIKQTLQALTFLHEVGLTHTDLKPENLMLQKDGGIKIIDFGGATWDRETRLHRINTRQYRAPEVILGCGQWGHPSDIWCLGCIAIELYSGTLFFNQNDCYQHLWMIEQQCGKIPDWMIQMGCFQQGSWDASSVNDFFILEELIEENDWALKELIEMMLLVDPTKRITAKKALNHHLFREL